MASSTTQMGSQQRIQRVLAHLAAGPSPAGASSAPTAAKRAGAHTDAAALSWTSSGSLRGKTLFITGGSRGIGLAIAVRAARDGANVIIAAKTAEPHPKLPGTIYTAAKEVEQAGGQALPVVCDIRFEDQVKKAVEAGVKRFGGIDIVVNNASAISITDTEQTSMKRYDLMHQVNSRGTFLVSKTCLPYLRQSSNPHILAMSPPLNMEERWFAPHVAYTSAKFGMSMVVLGMAGEFRSDGVAVNALWPRTTVATSAVKNLLGGDAMVNASRTPAVLADAAYAILTQPSGAVTGGFFIDEDVLRATGVADLSKYRINPNLREEDLAPDFFC